MVNSVLDCPATDERVKGMREITFRYDPKNENDSRIIHEFIRLCVEEQPCCENCENYYVEGYFCGYNAHVCRIHGNIEAWDHPHHDGDGSKCDDYTKIKGNNDG